MKTAPFGRLGEIADTSIWCAIAIHPVRLALRSVSLERIK